MKDTSLNVFGGPLMVCGTNPLTGAFRNGCCDTGQLDTGTHTVCAVVTDAFLSFSKHKGNDLTRPYPLYNFPGLVAGDRWCLCALRWKQAHHAGAAPLVDLDSTHEQVLTYVDKRLLLTYKLES